MKFEHTQVFGWDGAFRGMRNPKDSWAKSDSDFSDMCYNVGYRGSCETCQYFTGYGNPCAPLIGPEDMRLAKTLIRAGSEHRKFLRQIFVSVDITAPLFFWKEFDTYHVGTVANSTSTMHTIQRHPVNDKARYEVSDYHPELGLIDDINIGTRVDCFLDDLEQLRQLYVQTEDKQYWKELIRWLPCGWLQKRTVTMSYENLLRMCSKGQRRFHKLSEWKDDFIAWARTLPYAQDLIFLDELDDEAARVAKEELEREQENWDQVRVAALEKGITLEELLNVINTCDDPDLEYMPAPGGFVQ